MLCQIPIAVLFLASLHPAASAAGAPCIADERKPVRAAACEFSPSSTSMEATVRDQITEGLELIATRDAAFFEQLELWFARDAFGRAKSGAAQMVEPDGTIHPTQVDTFHDFIDEFVRALVQLDSNDVPRNDDFGKAAKAKAKHIAHPMARKELQATAKRLLSEMRALMQKANHTPGLRDIEREDASKLDLPRFVSRVQRMIVRVEVITSHCGLGPVFTGAIAEAEPLRDSLLRLAQAANDLLSDAEGPTAAQMKTFEGWLHHALDNARNLGRNAPAWKSASNGSRGELAVRALEGLRRNFKLMKSTLAER